MISVPMPIPATESNTISTPDMSMGTISWNLGTRCLGAKITSQMPICILPRFRCVLLLQLHYFHIHSLPERNCFCFIMKERESQMATNYGLMKSKYTTLALEGQNKIIFISDYNLIIYPHVQEISDMYHKLYTQLCVHIICVCVCAHLVGLQP